MSAFYDLNKTPRNILNQAIVRAIISENNGAWFDPSDLSTLFQDAAGTIPVTALEQPVGKWLDKSGNGNHATQSITASRPTLSARYNLLLNSATLSTQSVTTVAAQYTLSFTGTGSVTLSGTATGTLVGTVANNRVSLAFTPTSGTLTLTVTGSVTLAMLAFGTLTTYQAITTATNYDNVGWSRYVRFDGIDDYLNLPYMGLYANGSASIVAATTVTTQNSNARFISEGSVTTNSNYSIIRYLPTAPTDSVIVSDTGTTIADTSGVPYASSLCRILSIIDSGSIISSFRNSTAIESYSYARSGALSLSNTTIGAWVLSAASAYITTNIYGLIITKSALSDTDRRRCEQFLASRLATLGVILS